MSDGNARKEYIENGYYHIYNRGVEKRIIFQDKLDYNVFLSYLKEYLLPKNEADLYERLGNPNTSYKEKDKILKFLRLNNFSKEIILIAFVLMPNHFHFCVKQKSAGAIDKFMNSLGARYTMYFNKRYKRVGPLCQGVYKAVLINTNEQLLHLSRYIHNQALASPSNAWEAEGQPSSYKNYLELRHTEWTHPEEVLGYFSQENPSLSYQSFMKQEEDSFFLKDIIISEN